MHTDQIVIKTRRTIRQAVVIVFISVIAGLLTNQIRSETIPLVADWSPEARLSTDSGEGMIISLEEANALCSDEEAVFLDARSPEDYAMGHILCA